MLGHGDGDGDRGSAVVDFTLVGALLTLLFVGLLQLTMTLHVRSTLIDCAARGAGYGALADQEPQAGARRAQDLIAAQLGGRFAADVSARRVLLEGAEVVQVTVRAPLPLAGLLGPDRVLTVRGHALQQGAG